MTDPPWTVRRARPADTPALAALVATVAAEDRYILTEPPVDEAELAARLRAAMSSGDAALWVLEREGRIVGDLSLFRTAAPGVMALGIALLPAARGQGGGRRLMEAGLAWAREAGMHKVELEVFTDNAAAISLYAACGFGVEGLRREHHLRRDGTRRSALLMALVL